MCCPGFVPDETPDVLVERAELFLDCQERLGVLDRRLDLQSVANDARIREQTLLLPLAVLGDDGRVEAVEGFAIVLPLLEDRLPTQAGLCPFENQEFKELRSSWTGMPHSLSW